MTIPLEFGGTIFGIVLVVSAEFYILCSPHTCGLLSMLLIISSIIVASDAIASQSHGFGVVASGALL